MKKIGNRWVCLKCAHDEYNKETDELTEKYNDLFKKKKEELGKKEISELAQIIGIGKRYTRLTFEDFNPSCCEARQALDTCRNYARNFSRVLGNGEGLLMLGNPGTGKNHLSACICKEVAQQGHTALHGTLARILGQIMSKWDKGQEGTDQDELKKFARANLLVIDEVGPCMQNNYQKGYLFDLINLRYENLKPTILISNFNAKELEKYLENRIYDRLCQTSFVIEFTWESHRRK